MSSTTWLTIMLVACCLAFSASPPHALAQQDDVDVVAAANAFAQAQRAELNGEHARAAELYELADSAAPTPEALRNATRAWLAAGQPVSASHDAEELLRRYGSDPESRQLAEQVLARTKPELTRIAVRCGEVCTLVVNGLALGTFAQRDHVVYVEPGPHTLVARFEDGSSRTIRLRGEAGGSQMLEIAAPPASEGRETATAPESAEAPTSPRPVSLQDRAPSLSGRQRLPSAYFWSAASLTLAVGAVTLWSGLDLLNARDDYKSDPSRRKFKDGERKDLRTSLLIGSTAALAVGTATLAFFTDWKRSRERSPTLAVAGGRHGGMLLVEGRY